MGKITCIQGDALEVLPTLDSFDYLITDPPYPAMVLSGMKGQAMLTTRLMIDSMFQSFFMATFRAIPKNEVFRAWIFCDWRQVSFLASCLRLEGFDKQSCIVWDKQTGTSRSPMRQRTN